MVSANIKIDPELKKESQELFTRLGLTMTTAVNIFLRQAVREQAIPFRIGEPAPNIETVTAIKNAKNGICMSKGFDSVQALMEDLDADD